MTPKFLYAILLRAVRGAIIAIFNNINQAVYFKLSKSKNYNKIHQVKFQKIISSADLQIFCMIISQGRVKNMIW